MLFIFYKKSMKILCFVSIKIIGFLKDLASFCSFYFYTSWHKDLVIFNIQKVRGRKI